MYVCIYLELDGSRREKKRMSKINKERIGKVNRSDCHMSWKVFICFDSKWVLIGNQFVFIFFYILSSTVGGYWASDWNDSKIHLKYWVDCCLLFIQFSQKWIMILMDFISRIEWWPLAIKLKDFLHIKLYLYMWHCQMTKREGKGIQNTCLYFYNPSQKC